jgi:p-hydroxybenzoate 3-monooxygenase
MRSQVAIVGAGPAGLLLSHLLSQADIESIVLESRPRVYAERRVRASVLEPGTVDLLNASGVGQRLRQEGEVHHGIELRFDGQSHPVPLAELTDGRTMTVYDQHNLVQDLIQARLAAGGQVEFEAEVVGVDDPTSERPIVRYRKAGQQHDLACDVVVGCDGAWGVCRSVIPVAARTIYRREYPFAWLGLLAAVRPSRAELVYGYHDRGFVLWGLHAAELTRVYLQWRPTESLDDWTDDRLWQEIQTRLATSDGWTLDAGQIVEKGIATLHSLVTEPMQYGRLFLAGDAAHVVPLTAAKGMNLAIADVHVLAQALVAWYTTGANELLEAYSPTCLRRVWWAEHFSWWMTWMLHRFDDDFQHRLQLAQLRQIVTSRAAATTLAENYLGLTM